MGKAKLCASIFLAPYTRFFLLPALCFYSSSDDPNELPRAFRIWGFGERYTCRRWSGGSSSRRGDVSTAGPREVGGHPDGR
ncbi:hypothetical protein SEVIR_8G073549v4 [Setaria viridis]|uniref:Secreted protein n=1 Tax=Setaria viridis TaxID=4556 RepID=A0A4U6TCR4_SETVI|nr:hypothetical protein SEVIR_8G073549v2 [Setaria viridis]